MLGEDAIGRAVGEDPATRGEHHDARHEVGPHGGAVLDQHEGGRLSTHHPLHGGPHLGHPHGVEVRRGLVEQQQSGPHREHAGQGEALLLPTRERLGGAVEGHGETHGCHSLGHPRRDLGRGDAQVLAAEGDVVADLRQDDPRLGVLQHEADATALRLGRLAVDEDAAGRLPLVAAAEESREAGEERRLAGPGGPEEQHPLTGFDAQVNLARRGQLATGVAPAPALDVDARGMRHQTSRRASRPAANRLRAPVAARARTSSQPTRPASRAPETTSVPR